MELGNFGAIMRFALELEEQAIAFYEMAAQGGPEEPFRQLIRGSQKRLVRLERARREGVVEMALEPITGFDSDAYRVELTGDKAGCQRQAIVLEDTAIRFYRDAAEKLPILGVARLFERMARESEGRKAQLENLFGN